MSQKMYIHSNLYPINALIAVSHVKPPARGFTNITLHNHLERISI